MAAPSPPTSTISLPALPVESAMAKQKQAAEEQRQQQEFSSNNLLFIALGTVIILTSFILLLLLLLLIKRKKEELRNSTKLCLPSTCTTTTCTKSDIHVTPTMAAAAAAAVARALSPAQMKKLRIRSTSRSSSTVAAKAVARNSFQEYKYNEIQSATDDFSSIIGRGGYGTVYKARFSDGVVAAVKRMNDTRSRHSEHEFSKEMEFLSRLHHRHLVKLRGFCVRKRERFLVYEYMENGSLREHLRGGDNSKTPLSWQTRLQIAIDVASALEYLHCYCDPPLCHRDIKSSNILLDRKFTAKISDFGLAHAEKASVDMAIAVATTDVRGTPGYMDPEYVVTKKMTAKSDVYSYGVLLLELVSGRAAVQEKVNIVEWAERHTYSNSSSGGGEGVNVTGGDLTIGDASAAAAALLVVDVRAMADPCLKHSINSSIAEEMRNVVSLAMMCTRKESEKRPNIRQVMRWLQQQLQAEQQQPQQTVHVKSIAAAIASSSVDEEGTTVGGDEQGQQQQMVMMNACAVDSPSYLNISDEIGSLSSSPSPYYYYHYHGLHHPTWTDDICVSFRFETTPPLSPDIIEQHQQQR